jgi:hypothetical protein
MKKVICLSVFMVISMIMTISCTKCSDEPTYPPQVESLYDLDGSWEFVNFKLADVNYSECSQLTPNLSAYLMSFDVSTVAGTAKLKDKCVDPVGKVYTVIQTYNIPGKFTFQFREGSIPKVAFMYESYNNTTGELILSFYVNNTTNAGYLTVKKI